MKAPKPFCKDQNNIKAIVLGCDPTAFDKEHKRLEFEFVFDLGNDDRYFRGVIDNLKQINLSIDQVYVQNLVTDYQKEETSKNKSWHQTALEFIAIRKQEFDNLDPSGTIPVFLTSEVLYKALLNPNEAQHKAIQLYNDPESLPISAMSNLLGRPIIPLYRHWNYNLKKWPRYCEHVKCLFESE